MTGIWGGNPMKMSVLLIALVITLVFLSGCLSSPAVRESAEGGLRAHYEYSESWSPNQGCYERLTGYVYNVGNNSVDSVRLNFNLVNTGTGTIRDSRSVFIGTVGKSETRTYETVLDGECTQDYRVEIAFEK
jgi:starvation-inducible outer membrane lipoprotein